MAIPRRRSLLLAAAAVCAAATCSGVASAFSPLLHNQNSVGARGSRSRKQLLSRRCVQGPRRPDRHPTILFGVLANGGSTDDMTDDINFSQIDDIKENASSAKRRRFLHLACSLLTSSSTALAAGGGGAPRPAMAAVQRAVGSGEARCLQDNNCLETGEWDGAVGWSWGGKDRCDPADPNCGGDGRLRSGPIVGRPIPAETSSITHVAVIQLDIGRDETGVVRLGLYGDECPVSVQEAVDFLSTGLSTRANRQSSIGAVTKPVSLSTGGVVSNIVPGQTIGLGVPSQTIAYGRSRGLSKTAGFIPQSRPDAALTGSDRIVRGHDVAGLVSVPKRGIGYGGSGFEGDDEAYENALVITADSVPSLDSTNRVIGQVIDSESMAFLERLATLPTKRGIKGVIPGQTSGPPLLKVVVRQVAVSKVVGRPTTKAGS